MFKDKTLITLLCTSLALTACGGGGFGNSNDDNNATSSSGSSSSGSSSSGSSSSGSSSSGSSSSGSSSSGSSSSGSSSSGSSSSGSSSSGSSSSGSSSSGSSSSGSSSGSSTGGSSSGSTVSNEEFEKAVNVSIAVSDLTKQELFSKSYQTPIYTGKASPKQSKTSAVAATVNEDLEALTQSGACGGSTTVSGSTSYDDVDVYPVIVQAHQTFDDYCSYDQGTYTMVLNGTVDVLLNAQTETTGTYDIGMFITYETQTPSLPATGSVNQTASCTYSNGLDNFNINTDCDFYNSFDGDEGEYRSSNASITGDNSTGYDISVTVTNDAGDELISEFTGLTVCSNGNFGTGSGTVSYNGFEINIEYISCDEMVITYQGTAETITQ